MPTLNSRSSRCSENKDKILILQVSGIRKGLVGCMIFLGDGHTILLSPLHGAQEPGIRGALETCIDNNGALSH